MGALLRLYFDRVYNPIYDATTATLSRYRALQEACVQSLQLSADSKVLCVGLGTGNEAIALLREAPGLALWGVDLSPAALRICRRKLGRIGHTAELQVMDTAALAFPDCCFNRVMCMHVLDFVDKVQESIREMVRVLVPGGRFTITLPSQVESAAMGRALVRDHVRSARRAGRGAVAAAVELCALVPLGLLYLPLLARPGRRAFSRREVHALFAGLPVGGLEIREDRVYQDFIVSGTRT